MHGNEVIRGEWDLLHLITYLLFPSGGECLVFWKTFPWVMMPGGGWERCQGASCLDEALYPWAEHWLEAEWGGGGGRGASQSKKDLMEGSLPDQLRSAVVNWRCFYRIGCTKFLRINFIEMSCLPFHFSSNNVGRGGGRQRKLCKDMNQNTNSGAFQCACFSEYENNVWLL